MVHRVKSVFLLRQISPWIAGLALGWWILLKTSKWKTHFHRSESSPYSQEFSCGTPENMLPLHHKQNFQNFFVNGKHPYYHKLPWNTFPIGENKQHVVQLRGKTLTRSLFDFPRMSGAIWETKQKYHNTTATKYKAGKDVTKKGKKTRK